MNVKPQEKPTADLFAPITISGLTLKNRIIMPAFILNYPINGFEIGEEWLQFYRRRAEGGVGLIVVGACHVTPEGRQDEHQIGADSDEWIPALTKVAATIKEGGSVPALQLNHAGRYAKREINKLEPVAPSAIPSRYTKELPYELSTAEVEAIVDAFGKAAGRAKKAGFEAVEFLGATGYLISQFLSPLTNQRTDRFGGDEIKRRTFLKEIVAAVRREVGADFPLILRMSSTDNIPGGMTDADHRDLAVEAEKWGIHLLNVTAGWHDAPVHQIGPSVPQGAFVPYAAKIREVVNIPVSCAMRITEPGFARAAIADGRLDMVTLGRALIVDPDWPQKAEAGRDAAIRPCISCCNCFDRAFQRISVECSLNPALGDDFLPIAPKLKRVLVVGGGPAGMEAARVLATRGHKVTIQERSGQLGGRLGCASIPPHKSEIGKLTKYLAHELQELQVPVVAEADLVHLNEQFDGVVLATGARERTLSIPGMDSVRCYSSTQILEGKEPQGPVIVVGAGLVGGETALYLSSKGYDVTVVEIRSKALADMGATLRWVLLEHLKKGNVKVLTSASITEIKDGKAVIDTGNEKNGIPVGSLVLSVGFEADNDLVEEVERSGLPYCVIGDKKTPRRIKEAMHEGYWAGTQWADEVFR